MRTLIITYVLLPTNIARLVGKEHAEVELHQNIKIHESDKDCVLK